VDLWSLNDRSAALAGGRTPGGHFPVATAMPPLQARTVIVPVNVLAGVGAQFVVASVGAVTARASPLVGASKLVVSRWAVLADIIVTETTAWTVGHSTANKVGPVPNNLCKVADNFSVDGSLSIAPVFHLVVPGLDSFTPASLVTGHV